MPGNVYTQPLPAITVRLLDGDKKDVAIFYREFIQTNYSISLVLDGLPVGFSNNSEKSGIIVLYFYGGLVIHVLQATPQ